MSSTQSFSLAKAGRALLGTCSAVLAALALTTTPAQAQPAAKTCIECHDDAKVASKDGKTMHVDAASFKRSAHRKVECTTCHTQGLEAKHPDEPLGKVKPEVCVECHEDQMKEVAGSIHGKRASGAKAINDCTGCHDSLHTVRKSGDPDSPMSPVGQIKACGSCHEDMMTNYESSEHARALLKMGLTSAAPSCSSCHGKHTVLPKDDKNSLTHPLKIAQTCGACHTNVMREWQSSSHATALAAGKDSATCASCHEPHAMKNPAAAATRRQVSDGCGNCHKNVYASFKDGFHGKATALAHERAATCADCHTPHANLPKSDPRSSIHPDNLAKTCGACHQNVNAAFLTYDPHAKPSDPNRNPIVYWIWLAMTSLLAGVFGFFGLHGLLWLQRALVGKLRGEFHFGHGGTGPYVRRFTGMQMSVHITIVLSFLLLAATGLPLKFASSSWAPTAISFMGGAAVAGWLHRLAGAITFGYLGWHIVMLAYAWFVKGERGFFWGPRSMVPQLKDLQDFVGMMKYFFYIGPRPKFDRFTYWEKFDYLAVFWGVGAIGLSGLVLWFPTLFTAILPGWALNAAYVIHSDEALLATGFIFLFHFFHTHLRPEAFPMDPVIFTGSMPLERFKEERPLEYERMVAEGKLEQNLVAPPTSSRLIWAHVFGFAAVAVGVALAIFIFYALATGGFH